MKNRFLSLLLLAAVSASAQNPVKPGMNGFGAAQPQPFLFQVNTLTDATASWSVNYSGSYGERTSSPFGYDGVDQQLALKGYLGNRFTLYANAALGFARTGGVTGAQQAEVLRDVIGGKKLFGPRIGVGVGFSHDFANTSAIFSRITASYDVAKWRIGANLRFEKAFAADRDDIDLITSVGFHHRVVGAFYAGVEAVGQDLEGFWEADEAEGGAKLLIGPSVNYAPASSRFGFSLCGGPVFHATRSTVITSGAIRDLGVSDISNGFTVRGAITFNLHK